MITYLKTTQRVEVLVLLDLYKSTKHYPTTDKKRYMGVTVVAGIETTKFI